MQQHFLRFALRILRLQGIKATIGVLPCPKIVVWDMCRIDIGLEGPTREITGIFRIYIKSDKSRAFSLLTKFGLGRSQLLPSLLMSLGSERLEMVISLSTSVRDVKPFTAIVAVLPWHAWSVCSVGER